MFELFEGHALIGLGFQPNEQPLQLGPGGTLARDETLEINNHLTDPPNPQLRCAGKEV